MESESPAATAIARRLADALEARGVPYAIGGAIALGLLAPPRATNDVDVNVFVQPDELGPVLEALESVGATVDRARAPELARENGLFRAEILGMRIDVFVPSIPVYESAARRVRTARLQGRPIQILSAEDLAVVELLGDQDERLLRWDRIVAEYGRGIPG